MSEVILSIKNLQKSFGDVTALSGFSLDINSGEFITILGPSGCGKTTLLRIIAGLETADSGEIFLDGNNLSELQPEKRDVNTVFQNYALFPHMNVFDNISYGLKLKKTPKSEIALRVSEVLELVQLGGYEKRKVNQLSGGQKQRVAIARAIVLKPKVLLLDEPLGALDYKLRVSMQEELKKMQKEIGTTFVYITHDQEEALNLSDRIVLMSNAHIEQVGTPEEIYKKPQSIYAAKFIGEPNIFKGVKIGNKFDFDICTLNVDVDNDTEVYVVIRPESICISDDGVHAKVLSQSMKGSIVKTKLELDSGKIVTMHGFDTRSFNFGEQVCVCCKYDEIHIIKQKAGNGK